MFFLREFRSRQTRRHARTHAPTACMRNCCWQKCQRTATTTTTSTAIYFVSFYVFFFCCRCCGWIVSEARWLVCFEKRTLFAHSRCTIREFRFVSFLFLCSAVVVVVALKLFPDRWAHRNSWWPPASEANAPGHLNTYAYATTVWWPLFGPGS